MSSVPQLAKRSIRIVALPLVTASKTPEPSSSGHLTYYHFATPRPKQDGKRDWIQWATHKASNIWAGFGKAPEGHWKVRASHSAAFCPWHGTPRPARQPTPQADQSCLEEDVPIWRTPRRSHRLRRTCAEVTGPFPGTEASAVRALRGRSQARLYGKIYHLIHLISSQTVNVVVCQRMNRLSLMPC